jgi:hypothetical protein
MSLVVEGDDEGGITIKVSNKHNIMKILGYTVLI